MKRSNPANIPAGHHYAFTLIELLTVVAIIGVLIGVLTPTLGRARMSAQKVRDLSAAQQLIAGHLANSDENKGSVMPGYRKDLTAIDDRGEAITGEPANRHPWRLAPYLGYNFGFPGFYRDIDLLQNLREMSYDRYVYGVSVAPSMGLNTTFIGGNQNEYGPAGANGTISDVVQRTIGYSWLLRRVTDARRPSDLIVFAGAHRDENFYGVTLDGSFRVESPYFIQRRWQTAAPTNTSDPAQIGLLAPIYDSKAVVALLDGHAEVYDWNTLQDMRHWTPTADRPDWTLPRP